MIAFAVVCLRQTEIAAGDGQAMHLKESGEFGGLGYNLNAECVAGSQDQEEED